MSHDLSDKGRFTLVVPSDVRALGVVRRVVEELAQLAELSGRSVYDVVLAATEACTNIIVHAHRDISDAEVRLTCHVLDDGLEIRLRDQGEPFDFEAVPELSPTDSRHGGRGVLMIRGLMDQVTSAPLPEGGNEMVMVKRRKT